MCTVCRKGTKHAWEGCHQPKSSGGLLELGSGLGVGEGSGIGRDKGRCREQESTTLCTINFFNKKKA